MPHQNTKWTDPNIPNDYQQIKREHKESKKRKEDALLRKGMQEMKQRAMEQKSMKQKVSTVTTLYGDVNSGVQYQEPSVKVDFDSGEDAYKQRLRMSGQWCDSDVSR